MQDIARECVGCACERDLDRVRFVEEDIREWQPVDANYDLVVTHFFLDCFEAREVEAIVRKLALAAAPRATWLVAEFATPEGRFARAYAAIWLSVMYRFFRAVAGVRAGKLVDPTPFLAAAGFSLVERREWRGGFLRSDRWESGAERGIVINELQMGVSQGLDFLHFFTLIDDE